MNPYIVSLLTLCLTSSASAPIPNKPFTRIVFVGDSITAGVGVKVSKTDRYSALTTELLRTRHPDIVEINLGRSAQSLCQQSSGYVEAVLKERPDVVVIQWGVNDHYWGYSVAEFTLRYEALVSALRAANPKIAIVVTTLIADFRWPENQDEWIGEANIRLQEIAAKHHCHVADLHRALDHRKEFYTDDIHPNNTGAALMAKSIASALSASPRSPENAAVSFDQGNEVRFLQNVFFPARLGNTPNWIEVSEIGPLGMTVDTKIRITIRTAPLYAEGNYRLVLRNKTKQEIRRTEATVGYPRMLTITLDPKEQVGPFQVEITRL